MARNDLKDLVDKEIIEKKGLSDKTRYYVLAEIKTKDSYLKNMVQQQTLM